MQAMATNILITGQAFDDKSIRLLEQNDCRLDLRTDYLTEDQLADALQDKDIYVAGNLEYASERVLARSDHLRLIAVFGVGYKRWVDVEAATKRGIAVSNAPG